MPVDGSQLHREGSLVRVHANDSDQHQQPLSVLTSVEGDKGSVVSSKHREPETVSAEETWYEDPSHTSAPHAGQIISM